MTCSTRVSVRCVVSPVSNILGTTSGSVRSYRTGTFRSGLPRTNAIAGAQGWNLQASFSSISTRTSVPGFLPGVLSLRRWAVLHNLLSDVFGHDVALSFVVTNEEKLNSSVAAEGQKNAASRFPRGL